MFRRLGKYLNKILYIPNSFFDVRSTMIFVSLVFLVNFCYDFFFLKDNLFSAFSSALFYPLILLAAILVYSRILGNLKRELLIPRRWVNYGAALLVAVVVLEKFVYDFFFRGTNNLPLVLVAFITVISLVFNSTMNLWLKMSDKNLGALQRITGRDSLYNALYAYAWQWLEWVNNLALEKENVNKFIKSFHVREASDFFDNYVTITPYVVAYASEDVIREYKNLMLQIVAMNNIRTDMIDSGFASERNLLKLKGRQGDILLSLELMMVAMKHETTPMTSEERNDLIDLIRSRQEIRTLKNRILF